MAAAVVMMTVVAVNVVASAVASRVKARLHRQACMYVPRYSAARECMQPRVVARCAVTPMITLIIMPRY